MDTIVVASDIASVRRDIGSLLEGPDASVIYANSGRNVLEIVKESEVDLVIADMQIGSMGGVAVCLEMRLQASLDVIDEIPVLLVLDRNARGQMAGSSNRLTLFESVLRQKPSSTMVATKTTLMSRYQHSSLTTTLE